MIKYFINKQQRLFKLLTPLYHLFKYGTTKKYLYSWPEKSLIKCQLKEYKKRQGVKCDFRNPVLFTEKIQRYIFYCDNPDVNRITDKVTFKDYINEKLGPGYVIPMFGAWDNIQSFENDWRGLPEQFVLKSNLQCGGNCIKFIHHKSDVDFEELKKELSEWLKIENTLMNGPKRHLYWSTPMILAERYMANFKDQLFDYKFFCFDGEIYCIYVAQDHFGKDGSHITFYDTEWNKLNVQYGHHIVGDAECPKHFMQMKQIASKLSKGIPFVRVDFFDTAENLYLAELTFEPGDGMTPYYPVSFNREMGDKFKI